jgi:hypothetical protein
MLARPVVRARFDHCVITVGQGNNARVERDFGAGQAVRVTRAVEMLVVVADGAGDFS